MTAPVLLTPEEAAERLHMCAKTLRRLRNEGLIRYVALTERKIRFRPEDCDAFLESRIRESTPCPSTSRQTRRSSSTTSNIVAADFTARRARKRNEQQSR
ncbi:helix-turn-helix domain-containing protein [Sphingobium sp.]|uniref:helix-turn-helix domain-containing protein n=1 Tax=Sphingobium sp. TaxID=1912891 RepID=UPI0039C9312F